jgi:heme o synthase
MATDPTLTALEVATNVGPHCAERSSSALADYWALTKPEVSFLIAITVFAGFCLGSRSQSHPLSFGLLIHTLLGTLMVASGAGTLNQFVERRFDAQMRRTSRRPLAAGRLEPSRVLWFGILLSLAGSIYLALAVNSLASLLAVITLVSYLFLYTPLKRITPLCTLVGAFPGAVPPLIGWAGATGRLGSEAWLLYAVLFLWQFPHFMAIAWMYREDYARAGYQVLPSGERGGRLMAWQSVTPALALIPLSVAPVRLGHAGVGYLIGTWVLGSGFLYCAAKLALRRSNAIARQLLSTSIIYLPLMFALILADRV